LFRTLWRRDSRQVCIRGLLSTARCQSLRGKRGTHSVPSVKSHSAKQTKGKGEFCEMEGLRRTSCRSTQGGADRCEQNNNCLREKSEKGKGAAGGGRKERQSVGGRGKESSGSKGVKRVSKESRRVRQSCGILNKAAMPQRKVGRMGDFGGQGDR